MFRFRSFLLHLAVVNAYTFSIAPGVTLSIPEAQFGSFGNIFDLFSKSKPVEDERITPTPETPNLNLEDSKVIEVSEDKFFDILGGAADLESLQAELGIYSEPDFAESLAGDVHSFRAEGPSLRSKKTGVFLTNPKQAYCEPEMQTVSLGVESNNAVTYYPTCVRVMQCGGCCPKPDLFSCQPTDSETIVVRVLALTPERDENEVNARLTRTRSRGRRRRTNMRVHYDTVNVTIEEHKACSCMCKLKESECDLSVQIYDERNCACLCTNTDEEAKCRAKNSHVWDKESCNCLCRKTVNCSSSETFDHNTCSCKATEIGTNLNNVFTRSRAGIVSSRRKPVPVEI